jgi:hypothetical protein
MPAQQQVESGVGGVAINLGGVGQQNRKGIGRNAGGCLFDIIDPIIMRVVDTGQIDALAIPRDRLALIEQDANSHFFETGDHANRIVIAQHPIHRLAKMGPQSLHALKRIIKWSECRASIVARYGADVTFQFWEELFQASHRALVHIDVEITDVEKREAIEGTR